VGGVVGGCVVGGGVVPVVVPVSVGVGFGHEASTEGSHGLGAPLLFALWQPAASTAAAPMASINRMETLPVR
jgi:hypothetical protein